MSPELVELAKFSKQSIPKEHPKDAEKFVQSRIRQLCDLSARSGGPNVVSVLVSLANATTSGGGIELISRVFHALASGIHCLLIISHYLHSILNC